MRSWALAAVWLGLTAAPGWAETPDQPASSQLTRYQAREQRLQDIGWRLVRNNAPFCNESRVSIGLTLQDMAGFGSPDVARAALGLKRDFAVQSAATGSPSALAGLGSSQEVIGLAGQDPNSWPAEKRGDWKRLKRAHDLIDAELTTNGMIEIALESSPLATKITGQPICATRFELASNARSAKAEGTRVIVGEEFVGFEYAEGQLAAALSHELAHNLLRHRTWLEMNGRNQKNIRLTEREADRMMPWLLANAQYDPGNAAHFMETWGPRHDGGIFRARTHDGWDERLATIQAEIEVVKARVSESGAADWKQYFRRETAP